MTGNVPADTSRNTDVVITSKRRHFGRNYVKMTSFWRNNDVIITRIVWKIQKEENEASQHK